jgi:hypothetical protein
MPQFEKHKAGRLTSEAKLSCWQRYHLNGDTAGAEMIGG